MDSQSSFSKAKTFLYVISFSFLELCFLFLLLRRNHGLMPERKSKKKIEHFFVGLYKKFISFDDLFRRQHPCWSTLKIFKKSASLSSPFQFLHKPIQLSNLFFQPLIVKAFSVLFVVLP